MTDRDMQDPAFGTHRLPSFLASLRDFANNRGISYLDKRVASVIRKILYLSSTAPYDVGVFREQHVRLFPKSNRCEKRAFVGLSTWDNEERDLIAADIAAHDKVRPFVFLDCGANIGLYSLFARDETIYQGKSFRGLAIEPDPVNQKRLAFNLAASSASDIALAPYAVGRERGSVSFVSTVGNRGEAHIAQKSEIEAGEGLVEVAMRPLADLVIEQQLDHIDVMKIDIEGHELQALEPFFETADPALWPQKILIEVGREHTSPAMGLCLARGYRLQKATKINAYLSLEAPVAGPLSDQ